MSYNENTTPEFEYKDQERWIPKDQGQMNQSYYENSSAHNHQPVRHFVFVFFVQLTSKSSNSFGYCISYTYALEKERAYWWHTQTTKVVLSLILLLHTTWVLLYLLYIIGCYYTRCSRSTEKNQSFHEFRLNLFIDEILRTSTVKLNIKHKIHE